MTLPPDDPVAALPALRETITSFGPGGLLDRAAAVGCLVQDGLPMLLWQGVFALERWLGRSLPADVVAAMRAAL